VQTVGEADAFFRRSSLGQVRLASDVTPWLAAFEAAPARQIANLHTGFNLALAVIFLPMIGPMAKLLAKLWPDRPEPGQAGAGPDRPRG